MRIGRLAPREEERGAMEEEAARLVVEEEARTADYL